MSIVDLYEKKAQEDRSSYTDLKIRRSDLIYKIKNVRRYDVVVAGGGIQGAVFARLAAFNGLKVLLLEINDYASGTSGRTSKMAHGGLRYLEYYDFRQVMEGVKARENLFKTAPHLVKPQEFLMSVKKGEWFKKIKLKLGLTFYDFFLSRKSQRHKWISTNEGASELFPNNGDELMGFFRFYDGLMHDVRLVLENIFAARQEGAYCLNHARIDSIYQKQHDAEVAWTDLLSGEKYTSQCGIVVNTAGAWAPTLGRLSADKKMPQVRYSQGTHLLFNKKWVNPALLIPLPGKGRNYFVWPHASGTMVGTTEKELSSPSFNPKPTSEEIEEILSRLQNDVPNAGLNKDNLFHSFAGIRTLPSKGKAGQTFKLSRRHIWSYSQGILSLIGGKYTSALWTASEGLRLVYKFAGVSTRVIPLNERKLPGSYNLDVAIKEFTDQCKEKNVPQNVIDSCIRRHGAKVRVFSEIDPELDVISGRILKADLLFALHYEQADSLEDLYSRRLDLEFEADKGAPVLAELLKFLSQEKTEIQWEKQAEELRARLNLSET